MNSTLDAGPDALAALATLVRLRAEGAGDGALDAFAKAIVAWGRWARVAVLATGPAGVVGVGAAGFDPVEAEVLRREHAGLFERGSRVPPNAMSLEAGLDAYLMRHDVSAAESGPVGPLDRVLVLTHDDVGTAGLVAILSCPHDPARALDDDGLAHLNLVSSFAEAVWAVRRAGPLGGRDANEEAASVLSLVEDLNAIDDLQTLLDRLAETVARVGGWHVGVLSIYLPEGALLGGYNLPADERGRFALAMATTPPEKRAAKRAQIRSYAFPGTGICFVPNDSPILKGSAFTPSRVVAGGSWHPDDRLFLLVRTGARLEIGVLSLDEPLDGNRPDETRLERLRLAQRILDLGASFLYNRVLARDLRRGEEAYRTLVEGAPVGIYRRTASGRVLAANARLAEIFGYRSPEAILGDAKFLERFGISLDEVTADLDAAGEVRAADLKAHRLDGTEIRVRRTLRRTPDGHVLGIVEDVTQARRLEENLQRTQRLEALGTLASGVAHDFNNLLAGVLGYASLLLPRLEGRPDLVNMAKGIQDAALRAADLTRQLLGIARPTRSGVSRTDIVVVLADCARVAKETFDRRIEVELKVAGGPLFAIVDASELHRAVLNLCINARDAMPEGGRLTLAAEIDPVGPATAAAGAGPKGPFIRIDVRDTGVGMDDAVRARLFEPFFSTKPRGKGTGLGLYTVYQVLGAYEGSVEVESRVGIGTRFRLFLPVAAAHSPTTHVPLAALAQEPRGRAARVLLVEDEEAVRAVAEQVLTEHGHHVTVARDGEIAVTLFERNPSAYDVVVLDLVLPRLSGIEVFRRCRRLRPDLPVVLSSGNVYEGLDAPDVRDGVAGVLPKPYRPDELTAAVDRALRPAPRA